MKLQDWKEVNIWERDWWGEGVNTYMEETKQVVYAFAMGLKPFRKNSGVWIDIQGKNILDVGGGYVSLLLKTFNRGENLTVSDPILQYAPDWIKERYNFLGINITDKMGEELLEHTKYGEVWLYNVLQHTQDPVKILKHIKQIAPVIRICEWLDTPAQIGHPQTITKQMLDETLGIDIKVEEVCGKKAGVGVYEI